MLVVTYEQLDTAKERTDGAIESAIAAGFPKDKVFKAAEKTTDIPGSRDAATPILTKNSGIKHWLIASMNDTGAMGAVRATEQFKIAPADVIGIGINGDSALEDFKKAEPTGLFGSILLQAKRHGYETSDMMFHWIKDGKEPPKITFTDGILITRENYVKVLDEQGLPH
jgi:L-arabinose transport system substrate-binding protein